MMAHWIMFLAYKNVKASLNQHLISTVPLQRFITSKANFLFQEYVLIHYLASGLMLKLVAIRGTDTGLTQPVFKLAVLHLLKESTMMSLTSIQLFLYVDFGGSSMTKGMEETEDLSKK